MITMADVASLETDGLYCFVGKGRETTMRFFRGSIETDTPASNLRDVRQETAHDIALLVSGTRYPLACDADGKAWRTILATEGTGTTLAPHLGLVNLVLRTRTLPRCGYCQRYAQPEDTDGACPACDGGPCQ